MTTTGIINNKRQPNIRIQFPYLFFFQLQFKLFLIESVKLGKQKKKDIIYNSKILEQKKVDA